MAITASDAVRISDLVPNEKVLAGAIDLKLGERNEIVNSGLALRNPLVDAVAGGGPRKASLPYLLPLSADNVNVGTDDITEDGDIGKMNAEEFSVLRHDLNYAWGFADLVQMVTRYNVQGGIAAGIADYWNTIYNKMAVSTMIGALKTNSGLTYTSDAGADFYTAAMMAAASGGLDADAFDILIVSPAIYAQMRIDQKNAFVPGAATVSRFDEYAGLKLLKSKAFGSDMVLARSGALAFGEGNPPGMVPTEIERLANKATGQGATVLHSRRSVVVHANGFEWVGQVAPTVLKSGSTAPQIETASNWNLVVNDIEKVGFRRIKLTPKA